MKANNQIGRVEIDPESGFCFGVIKAVSRAEEILRQERNEPLYCLGDIVHNRAQVDRLESLGMRTIDHEQFSRLSNARVLYRAHGEPPASYTYAAEHGIEVVDATCPVVLRLQQKVRQAYLQHADDDTQIVIFGKPGHAEVNGLVGQTDGKAIVVREPKDLDLIDFSRSVELFSQTTMQEDQLEEMLSLIKSRLSGSATLIYHNTICQQVARRIPNIRAFAESHDRIFFVSDQKSSNGRVLYQNCLEVNPNTTFITYPSELTYDLVPSHEESIGVCGATSTSREQLQEIAEIIERWMQQRHSSATAEP